MPTTRKKVIKTVYKDDDDSEDLGGDFSDSGSDAKISPAPSSDESINEEENCPSSDDDVHKKPQKVSKTNRKKNPQFAKAFISKINKQICAEDDEPLPESTFTIKDLTEADKLLPSVLNLSESDSSDEDDPKPKIKKKYHTETLANENPDNDDNNAGIEYKDVWSVNEKDESEEIAKKTFLELEQHKAKIEEAKMSVLKYSSHKDEQISDVKDLLALGEEIEPEVGTIIKKKKKVQEQSDSEVEDWEEVNESKPIPQQGIQLIVDIPNSVSRKTKNIDIEMMMKRKMNRAKKECQVYMHKVHVLCWLGYGNYISTVLNDQEVMSTALSLLQNTKSKECYPSQKVNKKNVDKTPTFTENNTNFYPGQRVDMKYVEQITSWYQNKLILRKDKHENKFRPKAPKLKEILIQQIKNRIVTSKKYLVYVFVAMLRSLGLHCRVMLNFVTVPLKPSVYDLQSTSKKSTDKNNSGKDASKDKNTTASCPAKTYTKKKIPQLDGNYDCSTDSDSDISNIMQVDGNDDKLPRITRSTRRNTAEVNLNKQVVNTETTSKIMQVDGNNDEITPKTRSSRKAMSKENEKIAKETEGASPPKKAKQSGDNISEQVTTKSKLSLNLDRKRKGKNIKSGSNLEVPEIKETSGGNKEVTASTFFVGDEKPKTRSTRKRSATTNSRTSNDTVQEVPKKTTQAKARAKSTPVRNVDSSKSNENLSVSASKKPRSSSTIEEKNMKLLKPKDVTDNKDYLIEEDKKPQQSDSDDDFKVVKLSTTYARSPKKTNNAKQKEKLPTQDIKNDQNKYNKKAETNSAVIAVKTRSTRTSRNTKTVPKIEVSTENKEITASEFFTGENAATNVNKTKLSRKRTTTSNSTTNETVKTELTEKRSKPRAKSSPSRSANTSKYFKDENDLEDGQRVSHKDLLKQKTKAKNDVTSDLVDIIKNRVKEAKAESKKNKVKGTTKDSDEDSDHLPEVIKPRETIDDDFKAVKISPKPGPSRRIDRRVLSGDDEVLPDRIDVWCEVFVEELEEWVAVDVTRNKVHCTNEIYSKATHPVAYVVGWDNNNYLKDLTRRYVPHWNTITRKQRAELSWWNTAVAPWLGPKNARDKEEDERLDRLQLEAPLPTKITEYKNHPLYALKRHLLKFEALYPADAATLGFVRGEAVYARECVHVCKSRDIWLKDAKVVKLGEKPYKIVKGRPKWDKLSNQLIKDKPLEIFGPWQVIDYEPPVAENGIVPRNAYGNVELFKECMLPKGTVHIKLPGLNRVAKKLNIDCAPALTGFDFNSGGSHPVYDGFVICKEFEEVITEAWVKNQEELEQKEREKIDARVYGNWKRLIKGLFIRERLKARYGFNGPTPGTSQAKKKQKGPRLVVKKTK
ncbi:PREDICTED: DNA repair protein complementing XP-C cells homolog isoform X2 [Papilio polytes]|uniref:DNA repair protein complementing XP-C cells homolog isoform X2 n=1 Tax=Papilio polytes TaxID=76194 RepID=UPI000675CF42|nr:PREDICTED: DNA repair protein complementing XP-C cells homolog isoform X2 [Papilio polytes]